MSLIDRMVIKCDMCSHEEVYNKEKIVDMETAHWQDERVFFQITESTRFSGIIGKHVCHMCLVDFQRSIEVLGFRTNAQSVPPKMSILDRVQNRKRKMQQLEHLRILDEIQFS